ncbi:MAG: hypothetical protein ACPGWS_10110 [Solirubrobacterales bacterium]
MSAAALGMIERVLETARKHCETPGQWREVCRRVRLMTDESLQTATKLETQDVADRLFAALDDEFGYGKELLQGRSRAYLVAEPRRLFCFFAVGLGMSDATIASHLGGRDRSTIAHLRTAAARRIDSSAELRDRCDRIREAITTDA